MLVELWYGALPRPLTAFAWHHYFVVRTAERCDRYEVWQRKHAGGESLGYVYRNLMPPEDWHCGTSAVCLARWEGEQAEGIAGVLATALTTYRHRDRYRFFPGPNSNTFVAWALKEAGVSYSFNWRAIGCRYRAHS